MNEVRNRKLAIIPEIVTFVVMSLIEEIVEEVKNLPVDKQEEAYRLVHGLREGVIAERRSHLEKVFSSLSIEEAEEWEKNTLSCRKIDVESW